MRLELAGVVQPEALGPALRIMVVASVAVILFEGGLHPDLALPLPAEFAGAAAVVSPEA